jgi:hypothetical protein
VSGPHHPTMGGTLGAAIDSLSKNTRRAYVLAVRQLAEHYNKSQ